MTRFLPLCVLASLTGFAMAQTTPAPAPAAKPVPAAPANPWIVRTYTFAEDELANGFDTKDQGHLVLPALPGAKASEEEILAYLKRGNQVVSAYFSAIGYAPPQGSLLEFDPLSLTLVARTSEGYHELLKGLADQALKYRSQVLSCSLTILEADASVVREGMKEAATISNHEPVLVKLLALADQGKARHVTDLQTETRSGQRVKVSASDEHSNAADFTLDRDASTTTTLVRRNVGTTIEFDPVLGEDGEMIDLNFAFDHHFAPPTEHWSPVPARVGAHRVESRLTDFHTANVNSAISMISGTVKLLGVWKPESTAAADKTDMLQVAFLRANARRVLPLENPQVLQFLTTHGEKVIPTPKDPPPLPEGVPPGMIIRLFHVDPAFFSAPGDTSTAPADPFAAPAPSSSGVRPEPRFATRSTVLEVLRALGVNFPEGSSATFDSAHQILLVRNTPENVEYVAALLMRGSCNPVRTLTATAHVVQADGPMMRKILEETRRITDHSKAWQTLEEAAGKNQASIQRSIWLETRSGQRAKASAVHELMEVEVGYLKDQSSPAVVAPTPSPAAKPDASPSTNPSPAPAPQPTSPPPVAIISSQATLSGTHLANLVGTIFEIDPVIGEDGHTVDLNLSLDYDFAPPTQRARPEDPPDSVLRIESPGTDFHRAKVNLATTMNSGSWRLMGVWKPSGSAELEGKDILQALFIRTNVNSVMGKQ